MIRVEDVCLDKHYIFIKGENAKTHYKRFASLSSELEDRIRKLMEGAAHDWYLIGDGYKPGPEPIIDPLTVMQHADHHDLSMTARYANHADPHLVETIKEMAPRF